jgi:uncharacterized protein (TIGR02217 family)
MSINLVINDFVGDAAFAGFDETEPLNKEFEFVTDVVGHDSGIEQRNQIMEQPKRRWAINWPMLDQAARDKLIELYQRAKGRYEDFLYADRWDYETAFTDWSYTAIGGETTTQLGKTYYIGETEAWTEDKKKIQPSAKFAPAVKIDAAAKTEGQEYTLDDSTGIIDWTGGAAPEGSLVAGEVVTANYYFYFKVRFENDVHIDTMMQARLWSAAPLALVEVIP